MANNIRDSPQGNKVYAEMDYGSIQDILIYFLNLLHGLDSDSLG